MPLKRSAFTLALLMGATPAALHAQALGSPAPAPLFGAPAAPAEAAVPSRQPGRAATAGTPSGFWVLDRPKPATDPAEAIAPEAQQPPAIDTSALRYYARQNDLARVAAEIRLLRAKHPGWEPPEDLFADVRGGEDEQSLWDLYAKHDIAGLKTAIEERRQRTPGWQPSGDLAGKLAQAEAMDELVRASDAKQWDAVVAAAAGTPALMGCGTIDALWRTAEALVRTGDEARALDAYRYVLATCTKPADRLATVQKASTLLQSPEAVAELIGMGRRGAGARSEFEQVRLDAIRQRVGDAAAAKPGVVLATAEIDELASRARAPDGRNDAELLGWLANSRKDYSGAESWFRSALQAGPDAKAAEGLVLALRDGGKRPEAVQAALRYADLGAPNRKLMVEVLAGAVADPAVPALTPEQTAALESGIDTLKAADAAQSYGWSRFKANDVAGAEAWFRKSAAWQPSEAAAIGLIVTAGRLKRQAEARALIAQYRSYPKVAALEAVMTAAHPARAAKRTAQAGRPRRATADQAAPAERGPGWDNGASAIVKTFESGRYDEAMAQLDARKAARRSEPDGLAVVRGWALYKKGDWDGAQKVFTELSAKGMTREAREGLRVIELGYTNPRFR